MLHVNGYSESNSYGLGSLKAAICLVLVYNNTHVQAYSQYGDESIAVGRSSSGKDKK